MTEFEGFPKQAFTFLRNLDRHNEKAWFDEHRSDYEAHLLQPAKAFVEAMGARLSVIAPGIHAEPRINGSIRRLNRDVRFSKDKRPYKDHLDFHFPDGPTKTCSTSSFMLRLTAKKIYVVVGSHEFSKPSLAAYRDAVAGNRGAELDKLAKRLTKSGYEVGGATYKRVPRGYDSALPHAQYLLHSGLHAVWSGPPPAEAHTPKFPAWCMRHYKKLLPIHEWTKHALGAA